MKTANKSFANVADLGKIIVSQNFIYKGIKSRLNLGKDCYHSVQNILYYCLLSKIVKMNI